MSGQAQRFTQPTARSHDIERPDGLPMRRGERLACPYIYAHYESKWYHSMRIDPATGERYGWLPRPSKINGKPGANGVTDPGRGKPVTLANMRGTLNAVAAKGGMVIYPTDKRLGPYLAYDKFYPTRDGRKYFIEPGESCLVTPAGTKKWNRDDAVGHSLKFHAHLRFSGLVHDFHREFYQDKMSLEQDRLSRFEQDSAGNPALNFKVAAQRERIEAMAEDWERYEEELISRAGAGEEPVVQRASDYATPTPVSSQTQPTMTTEEGDQLLSEGLTLGMLIASNGWIIYDETKIGRGRPAAVSALINDPELRARLRSAIEEAKA